VVDHVYGNVFFLLVRIKPLKCCKKVV
jgi:hypothetical protein